MQRNLKRKLDALASVGQAIKRQRTASFRPNIRRTAFANRALAVARGRRAAAFRRRNVVTAGFLGIERKFYDTTLTATALVAPTDASGAEFDPSATSMISTPAVGDTEQNRDGKQIVIESVELNGTLNVPTSELAAGPAPGTTCYVALVLDTQSNAAQMNSEDCFKNTSAAANQAANPMRNLLFGKRFRILKAEQFDLTPEAISHFAVDSFSASGKIEQFRWFLPMRLQVNFNAGTTASIANVIDNSLHVIAYVNNTGLAPTIAYNARIRFRG